MKVKALILTVFLAACVATDPNAPPADVQPGDLLVGGADGDLIEREPDLCHAVDYQQYVGQPGTIVPTLRITRVHRVVEYRGIVTQEYNPSRLNFLLDQAGLIAQVVCG